MTFNIKKVAPWNWTQDEEGSESRPMQVSDRNVTTNPVNQLHDQIDRLFNDMFSQAGFGSPALRGFGGSTAPASAAQTAFLRPNVDIAATDKEYTVTAEIPGVNEDDISLEVAQDNLIIRGEKKAEEKQEDKDIHRIERAYGSFQRVLSMPEDADRDNIEAQFNNGVLTVNVPRKAESGSGRRQIGITRAA